MNIRLAAADDAEAILAIYAPYVRDTAITFEYDVPGLGEFRSRVTETLKNYPYLVAEEDGNIVGYAYAGPVRTRAAYRHSAEMTVYVARECRRRGIGKKLYRELEKLLLRQNVFAVYACVTSSVRADDPYVTDASVRFHEKMGYAETGVFHQCGNKFGRWYGVIWLEKNLGTRPENPEPFLPFPET